jgi:putative SOS response-associated peptidase YedK
MKWGLPSSPSSKQLLFNARSETIHTKPTFRPLITRRQSCVWAIDGYYEWKDRQPYFVCRKDGAPMLLAGLWKDDSSHDGENAEQRSFTILTMDAATFSSTMAKLHPRQPVILADYYTALKWLCEPFNHSTALDSSTASLSANISEQLHYYPVTKRMSDGKYRGDDCTKKIVLTSIESFLGKKAGGDDSVAKNNDAADNSQDAVHVHVNRNNVTMQHKEPIKKHSLKLETSQSDTINDNPSWTCTLCTYIHTTDRSNKFLSCEMCGAKRETFAVAAANNAECGMGNNNNTTLDTNKDDCATSRAWGSLCSPKSAKKRKL